MCYYFFPIPLSFPIIEVVYYDFTSTVTSILADGPPVRVLIFAYYRGGTALMDELFTPLENMAHHNEPLKSFYQAVKGSLEYPVIISGNDTYRWVDYPTYPYKHSNINS